MLDLFHDAMRETNNTKQKADAINREPAWSYSTLACTTKLLALKRKSNMTVTSSKQPIFKLNL
jgi:hypothetical protein